MQIYESHLPYHYYGRSGMDTKLMIIEHKTIKNVKLEDIGDFLEAGDLLVFNNSRLVPSSIEAYSEDLDEFVTFNIGTLRRKKEFLLEVRPKKIQGNVRQGFAFDLPFLNARVTLTRKYEAFRRYWWATLENTTMDIDMILDVWGKYIRYDHILFDLDPRDYLTIFSKVSGSVELPSASYYINSELLRKIIQKGVKIAEITLHCNLGSLELPEFEGRNDLLPERYGIPFETMKQVRAVKKNGGKIIAVGTTVVRTLESYYTLGNLRRLWMNLYSIIKGKKQIDGETSILIDGNFRRKVVDEILTGMHEMDSSHILMLESFINRETLNKSYLEAIKLGYQWHEFGDLALIISPLRSQRELTL